MQHPSIAFIGGGNMAQSLIGGLIQDGWPADNITVAEPDAEKLSALHAAFGVKTTTDNADAVASADCLVLAVKPQIMFPVIDALKDKPAPELVISIAAGIPTASLEQWYQTPLAAVRAMPNTPALLGAGATGLYANERVSDEQRSIAESILRAVGVIQWVTTELDIDRVTALSGSGPAYFFLMMEACMEAAEEMGLSTEAAALLTKQTALGAGKMAIESDISPAELRARVTSPGGTTEAALNSMQSNKFKSIVKEALNAAFERSQELGKMLGDN